MNIFYDYQIFYEQKFGGISRYFTELYRNLQLLECQPDIGLAYSNNVYLKPMCDIDTAKFRGFDTFLPHLNFRGKRLLYKLLTTTNCLKNYEKTNQQICIDKLKTNATSVFHPTYYDGYFLKAIKNRPFVITVHDMIHFKMDKPTFSNPLKINRETLIKKSSKIIAVSENTKKDIVEILNVHPDKITVIHLGNSLHSENRVIDEFFTAGLPKNYILYVGLRGGYKNFATFIQAVANLLKADETLHLVCTGPAFTASETATLENLKIKNRVVHFFATENQLALLYTYALCFVFPSLYEGFGIPILESFACQCPVVLSNSSSLPEVAGDAAEYFDPQSQQQIEDAIKRIIYNPAYAQTLVAKGTERLKQFSWLQCAEQHKKLYCQLL